MKAFLLASRCLLLLGVFLALRLDAQVNVTTWHNDQSRTGQNLNETILTPANVNYLKFGQLFQYTVDGNVYAQPLYLSGLTISGTVYNVIFICTAHDSVYAFNADSNAGANGGLLWHVSLGTSAVTPNSTFGNRYGNYQDIVPEVGIIGTPVIDSTTGTLYVDAFTNDSGTTYYHRIHALNVLTGAEKFGGPLLVQATYPGNGVASTSGVLSFSNEYLNQRPALALVNGQLIVPYASFADTNPYHGWVLSFNTSPSLSLSQAWVTTPNSTTAQFGSNAGEGGIWEGGGGLCIDPNTGNTLFMIVGNGIYGNASGGFTSPTEFGDSFVKISTSTFPTSTTPPLDWFTPYNQASLQSSDSDVGAGGPMLLPNGVGSSAHPHLLIGGGKAGLMYLVDRDTMTTGTTHYATSGSTNPNFGSLQISSSAAIFSTPAYFNGAIYYGAQSDVMRRFTISNGVLAGPITSGTRSLAHPGVTPSISASGTSNGIVWGISYGTPAVLFACNASSVATEIYNSAQAGSRDQLANGVKFAVPTVVNGKVYVGASHAVGVFGLFPAASSPPGAPTSLTAEPITSTQINIAWTDNATTANGYEIWRSTDDATFTQINIAASSGTNFDDTTCAVNTTYYYKVCAENSDGTSAFTNVANATTLDSQASPSLVAHWALDDGSGLIATDSVGGDSGTLTGEVSWTTGIIGGALDFHGGGAATARVSIPDESAIDFSGTQSFTVTTWVNPGNTPGKYSEIISKSRGVSPWYELGIDPANNWVFRGTASDVEGTPVATGWHHLAAVQNAAAGTRTLYVDGVAVGTGTGTAQAANGNGELVFAEADTVSEAYSGIIDDVRIYNQALAASQIATLAQTTWTDSDIGSVGIAGSATIYEGVFAVNGSGADIWNDADAFNFLYQQVTGDCVITGRVVSIQDTNTWAKTGVMIRQTLDPGSTFEDLVDSYSSGTAMQWRPTANNGCDGTATNTTPWPYWVRLTRTGNVITAYQAPDGVTWSEVGAETLTMPSTVYVGICVTAHNNADLCGGSMDNVTVSTEGSLAFSNAGYTVGETSTGATITVSRTGGSLDAVGVTYATVPGGLAVAGTNYTPVSGTLNWANGDASTKSFTVPILNPNIAGPNPTVDLQLSNPTGGITLGTLSTASLTIIETSYNTWLYEVYGANAGNSAYSSTLAAPAGDGICNLVKYAMSISPGANPQSHLPAVAMVNGHPQVTFQWNYNISDVTYVVQASSSPNGPWSPLVTYTAAGGWVVNTAGATVTPGSVAGTAPYQYEPVTVTDPATVTAGQGRFYSVSVTR